MPEIEGVQFPDTKIIPWFNALVEEVAGAQVVAQGARAVRSDADLVTAAEILAKVEFVIRRAETVRVDMGRPYRSYAEWLSTQVNELVSPLTAITERLSGEIAEHRRVQQEAIDKERAKQEKLAAKRQERENKKAAKLGRDPIIHSAPEIPDVPKTIETSDGSKITTKSYRKYKVIDFSLLPERFKQENKSELNKAARSKEDAPPGAEFYYEDGSQFDFG